MRNYSEWEYPDKNREKSEKKISPTFWQVIHYLGEDDQSFLEAKRVIYHPMSLIWVNLILWFLFRSCVDHTKRSNCSNTGYHGVKKWTFSLDPITRINSIIGHCGCVFHNCFGMFVRVHSLRVSACLKTKAGTNETTGIFQKCVYLVVVFLLILEKETFD